MGSNPIVSKMSKRKFKTDGINRLQFEKDELKVLALRFFKSNQELPKKIFCYQICFLQN